MAIPKGTVEVKLRDINNKEIVKTLSIIDVEHIMSSYFKNCVGARISGLSLRNVNGHKKSTLIFNE